MLFFRGNRPFWSIVKVHVISLPSVKKKEYHYEILDFPPLANIGPLMRPCLITGRKK
jgi:hypothetical protein